MNATRRVSLSGISAGAFMAVQLQLAHSSIVAGAAIFAGGPWACARDNALTAVDRCMLGLGDIDVRALLDVAAADAAAGRLDGLGNVSSHAVFVFAGALDSVVSPRVGRALVDMYGRLGVLAIDTDFALAAEHAWPTRAFGNDCDALGEPFLSRCNYDGAGRALRAIYGERDRVPTMAVT